MTAALVIGMMLAAMAADAAADEPAVTTTPWGAIAERPAGSGRHEARIDRRPADGRLAIPRGFPQIVRATLVEVDAPPRELAVELSADASEVVVVLPQPPAANAGVVHLHTAEESRQFPDGRIVFAARDAKVLGAAARLESNPGSHRIGFWTDAADAVRWQRAGTRWGRYDAWLTYSTASPDGTEIEVEVNGTKLPATLRSTGNWYRYATLPLGTVYLPEAGPQQVTVRCTKKVGAAVMNLKAVTLEPACEGTPPEQADDGGITLHGRDATVLGTKLRYEPAEAKQTLGFWTQAGDAAAWTFAVRRGGEFDVEVLQGCGGGQGGSTVVVAFDADRAAAPAPLEFVVEDTGHFQAFKPRVVGRVALAAGGHTLRVQPRTIAKAAACDIRQVRLVPVAAGSEPPRSPIAP